MYYKNLPLKNMSNCRDIGGYPTKDGKITNYGVFIRSEAPIDLTPDEINLLKNYNITKSLDFRGDGDIVKFPSVLNSKDFEYKHIAMFGRADAMGFDSENSDPSKDFQGWGKSYIQWLETYKGWVRDVFIELATTKGACQYNCNAGKDRTGIITGLMLALVGVDNCDIAFDYSLSRSLLKPRFKALTKQWAHWDYLIDSNGNLIENHPFLYTPKTAMLDMLSYLETNYGTIENYLLSCNISQDILDIIKTKLVG